MYHVSPRVGYDCCDMCQTNREHYCTHRVTLPSASEGFYGRLYRRPLRYPGKPGSPHGLYPFLAQYHYVFSPGCLCAMPSSTRKLMRFKHVMAVYVLIQLADCILFNNLGKKRYVRYQSVISCFHNLVLKWSKMCFIFNFFTPYIFPIYRGNATTLGSCCQSLLKNENPLGTEALSVKSDSVFKHVLTKNRLLSHFQQCNLISNPTCYSLTDSL